MKVRSSQIRSRGSQVLISLMAAISTGCAALASDLIANPTFADADGNGSPDGWEVKSLTKDVQTVWVVEKWKDGQPCMSMKVSRKDKSSFTAEMTTVFSGQPGFYNVSVTYLDEFDGISKAKLLVNGKVISVWNFDGTFADCWREEVIKNVELKTGDKITIWGRDNPTEYCRIRAVRIEPSQNPPSAKEIEEMHTPPVIAEAKLGPLAPLSGNSDLSGLDASPEYSPLIINGGLRFLSKGGETLRFNLRFQHPSRPATYSLIFYGAEGTGFEKGTTILDKSPVAVEANGDAQIFVKTKDSGLYGLDIQGGNFYAQCDFPCVIPAPKDNKSSDNRNSPILRATGSFYFYVPKGVQAFGIGAFPNGGYIGEVTVRGPDGALVTRLDVPLDAPFGVPVRVRPGQDGKVWSVTIEGVSPAVKIFGVPPYLAAHPRYLLAPK